MLWGSNPLRGKTFLSSQRLWCQLASYSIIFRVISRRYGDRGLVLTTYVILVSRLRMGGAIHLLSLYAFVAWTVKNLYIKNHTVYSKKCKIFSSLLVEVRIKIFYCLSLMAYFCN